MILRYVFRLLIVCFPLGAPLFGQGAAEDEAGLVGRIHDRIVKASKPLAADRMAEYTTKIPGSEASFTMVPIAGGEFVMGTPESEAGRSDDEGPQHKASAAPFWMGRTEVTWDEYRLFMLRMSSGRSDGDELVDAVTSPTPQYMEMSFGMGINGFPAISMTQHAASKYAQWLSAKTGQFYRLPTEAEWEYACRAGTATVYSFGNDASQLQEYGWSEDNSPDQYREVGTKRPNPWGLYDMHGNVSEWTLDQYTPGYPAADASEPVSNPWRKADDLYPRVVRGGSWYEGPERARCGARAASAEDWKSQDPQLPRSIWYHTDAIWVGFRLVRPLEIPSAEEMYEYWNSATDKE